jgi:aquaporin Z
VAQRRARAGAERPDREVGTLTLIHLISIPITGTSVNPARSLGPAIFQGSWALSQLWMFIVAPLVGGAVGGLLYHMLMKKPAAGTETAAS